MAERATDRTVIAVTGKDRMDFLQGLVSNDVRKLRDGPRYAALLTPQGKYLADFFMVDDDDRILLDVKTDLAESLLRRLTMYRLRADVALETTDLHVLRGLGNPPSGAWADPRDPALGWRMITPDQGDTPLIDWDEIRVGRCIPETGIELMPDDTYILEAGFERLSGVDFRKGCYVGQEVTARMKHKTELRKGFETVRIEGKAPVGTPIESNGRTVGTLFTQSGNRAIAYLRFDRAEGELTAGAAKIERIG